MSPLKPLARRHEPELCPGRPNPEPDHADMSFPRHCVVKYTRRKLDTW